MTSVSNNNPVSQLNALASSQPAANATQAASNATPASSQSATSSSRAVAANVGAGYAGATQAIVGYLLNQQGAPAGSPASTSTDAVASVVTSASGARPSGHKFAAPNAESASSDTGKSTKGSGAAHGAGGASGGSSASSSSTTTETETLADGSVMQITLDGTGKVVSEAVIKGATPQNTSRQGPSTS